MTTKSYKQGKHNQEEVCARTFTNWLSSNLGIDYDLKRVDECLDVNGTWDFIASSKNDNKWLALEIKGLVIPQSLRQFGSWSRLGKAGYGTRRR